MQRTSELAGNPGQFLQPRSFRAVVGSGRGDFSDRGQRNVAESNRVRGLITHGSSDSENE